MVIVALLILLGAFSFAIPQKDIKKYFIISSILISCIFFFYTPPETDDLYRYYNLFDIVKELSAKELIHSQFNVSDWLYNYLLTDYLQNSKSFMVIMFILSRIGVKELLPVFFSLLTYIPLICVICDIGERNNYSKQAMCICFTILLACIDVRFLTALRNMSAYSCFVALLYWDLVRNKKKLLCFIGYLILCELHMSCVVLLGIRLVLLITKKRFRYIILLVMLSLFAFTEQIASIIKSYFGSVPFMTRLAKRMLDYNIGRTNYNFNGAIFFVGSIIVCLVCYLLIKNRDSISKEYELYGCVFLYFLTYTIGSIKQYDVLTRNCQLIAMMVIPFMMTFANDIRIKSGVISIGLQEKKIGSNNQVIFALIVVLVFFSYIFYGLFSYTPLQGGMRFF